MEEIEKQIKKRKKKEKESQKTLASECCWWGLIGEHQEESKVRVPDFIFIK